MTESCNKFTDSNSFLRNNDVRVHTYSTQGGRRYMEDSFSVAYTHEPMPCGPDVSMDSIDRNGFKIDTVSCLKYVYVGIFDGHGGKEAALFTRQHLLNNITASKLFWSDTDTDICQAIREGFLSTHYAMLNELDKWPTTSAGFPSTSGTTASICFIMNNKLYTGHVGDSKIVLGRMNPETRMWIANPLTTDHKPDSPEERKRIAAAGGEVMNKSGIERVVWYRPKSALKGPIRRSTNFDRIPFLAVARSLGDLWSYNPDQDTYIVSPDPDVDVVPIDENRDKCLVFASDGLWNMLLDHESIRLVQEIEEPDKVDKHILSTVYSQSYSTNNTLNPSQALVDFALQKWYSQRLRADNTTVVTLTFKKRGSGLSLSSRPVATINGPCVLPFCQRPFEYLISSNESQTGPREHLIDSFDAAFGKVSRNCHGRDLVGALNSDTNTSPPLQPLSTFTNNQLSPLSDQQVPFTPICFEECKSSGTNNSSSGRASTHPKVHKIISGFEVFRDYADDDDSRSSGENDEARAINGKRCRDESCSVSEELVDRHRNSQPQISCSEFQIKVPTITVPRPFDPDALNVLREVAKNEISGFGHRASKKRRFSADESCSSVTGITFKRRRCSYDLSPPAKHLRSSRWSRGITILPSRSACKRRWTKVAASILTKSRLRARKSTNRF